jgi:hypothetical protein
MEARSWDWGYCSSFSSRVNEVCFCGDKTGFRNSSEHARSSLNALLGLLGPLTNTHLELSGEDFFDMKLKPPTEFEGKFDILGYDFPGYF